MIGTTLAHYRITAALGAGGMGEVWRAEDEKLGREVALKVLPEEFAADPERMARFEREAKVLASLNHPNIATLYGLEQVSGTDADAGPTIFLAMELVEGEDLSQRIERGPISVEEAIQIALQIAEALEAAHEQGIVHRDLKPANIKLRPDGTVKVLDFGLAKSWETDHADSSLSLSPTLTAHATAAGVILGTAAYMSPEQARGKRVDRRADIWAFGVVLWEMLTGRKLFDGETVTDVLAAVVRQEIDLDALPGTIPMTVRGLLGRCLDREPRQRLRDIGEARIALAKQPESDEASFPGDGRVWLTRRSFAVTSALTGVGAALGFGLGRYVAGPTPADRIGTPLEIARLTNSGKVIAAAISPDARYIAYVESDQGLQSLWLRQLASGQTLRLIPDRPVAYWGHTFSPDGNNVVFGLKAEGELSGAFFSISTLGGAQRRLVSGIDSAPAYSPDRERMAYLRTSFPSAEESALMIASADGSEPKALAVYRLPEFVSPIFFAGPAWSPDGSYIVTAVGRLGSTTADARARLDSVALADGSVSVFSDPGWLHAGQAQFIPNGRGLLVIARGSHQPYSQIWLVRSPGGKTSAVTNGLEDHRIISLSQDGESLVTVSGDISSAIWIGPRDGSARPRRQTWARLDGIRGICFSPDGRLVYSTEEGGRWGLWTMTPDGGERAPLLTLAPRETILGVAISGKGDMFMSIRTSAGIEIRVASADGSDKRVAVRDVDNGDISVARDGTLVYSSLVGGAPRVFRLDAAGAAPIAVTGWSAFGPSIEPSGERIAFYSTDDTGRFRIDIVPREGGEPIWSAPAEPPNTRSRLILRENGLYLNTVPGDRSNVWQLTMDESQPRSITEFDDQNLFDFAFSDDGGTMAVTRGPRLRDALLIKGFPGSPAKVDG